ncbi:MAG: M3 family metallopeptidase [Acidobacteriota bacterium]
MRGLVALAALAACQQPGSGSYFARPGHFAHTAPTPELVATCRQQLAKVKADVDGLLAVHGVRDATNTLDAYNDIERQLDNAGDWASLLSEVAPDANVRDAARACSREVERTWSELWLDRRVYDAIRSVDISLADAETKRFVASVLRDMKRSGVELDDQGRARIAEIDGQLAKLSQQFQRNVDNDVRSISITDPSRLAGMPRDWIAAHAPDASGAIRVTTDYPDYIPFMTYADDDELRKQLYVAFRSRGDAHNEQILHDVLALRAEKARLLGFADWVEYESDDKMLRGGKAIAEMLDRVQQAAAARAKRDYAELLAQLRKQDPEAAAVGEWQEAWLENQVKRDRYGVDAAEVRKYLPYDRVLAELLELTSTIYDLQYVPVTDARAWHPDVQVFDVMREGDKLGRIFLDMHPRAGKYKHAAEFGITEGVKGVQLPEAALVCNLSSTFVDHRELVTTLHEFGHLMHAILGGQHHFVRQSGIQTERDFVEAPSEMFEEWAWSYDVLARFGIPEQLVERMRRAEHFGKATWVQGQLVYAAVALRYHQDDPSKLDQVAVFKQIQKQYTPFTLVAGTKPQAAFGHLIEYSSMYYTYLWSLVIARDLLTPFAQRGLLATDVTFAFRDKVLAPGGTKPAAELVKDFLGRPFNYGAFERWLASAPPQY